MDYCLLFKTRRLLGAQTTWIDLPDYPDQLQHYMHDSSWLQNLELDSRFSPTALLGWLHDLRLGAPRPPCHESIPALRATARAADLFG